MWNEAKADQLIPEHMQGGLKRYIESGIEPGSFLMAVLENNLKETFARADSINSTKVRDYVDFLYNYAPSVCWGSPEKVANWIKMHEERLAETRKDCGGKWLIKKESKDG